MSLEDGRLLASPISAGGDLGGTALSSDGRMFAIGNQHGQVEFYDTATWRRLGDPLDCHSDGLWRVAFSPDGRRMVTSGSGREPLTVWDVESRQQICTLPVEPAMATFLQFSADGRSLAFGIPSGQVRIITVDLPR
jgi:WD40 repeat protein